MGAHLGPKVARLKKLHHCILLPPFSLMRADSEGWQPELC